MRWDNLGDTPAAPADIALFGTDAVTTRTFDAPKLSP